MLKTLGAEPFSYKLELFDEIPTTQKTSSVNEQIFERLKIEDSIWDCCQYGKNLTFFSIEDQSNKNGLSSLFNGKSVSDG